MKDRVNAFDCLEYGMCSVFVSTPWSSSSLPCCMVSHGPLHPIMPLCWSLTASVWSGPHRVFLSTCLCCSFCSWRYWLFSAHYSSFICVCADDTPRDKSGLDLASLRTKKTPQCTKIIGNLTMAKAGSKLFNLWSRNVLCYLMLTRSRTAGRRAVFVSSLKTSAAY